MDEIFQGLLKGQKMRTQDFQAGFRKGVNAAARELSHYYAGKYTEKELARILLKLTYDKQQTKVS